MSDTTNKPKMEIKIGSGGLYYHVDPKTGATSTSPSLSGLRQELEDAQAEKDRAAKRETDYFAKIEARKAEAAAQLTDLEPRLAEAQQARDQAWTEFAAEALTGGEWLETYAIYTLTFRAADSLKLQVNDLRHEERHGMDRKGAPVAGRPLPLLEALQRVADDRIAALTAEGRP